MLPAAPVVWILHDSPTDAARGLLAEWAEAHGVAIEDARPSAPRAIAIDWTAGEDANDALAQARDGLVAEDYDATERQLARAGAILRAHPELPQAAWLRAEVERGWSARWLREGRPEDEDRAKRAWQRAAALDGGREPGIGERAFDSAPNVTARFEVSGDARLRVDGDDVKPGDVKRGAGEHAVALVDARGHVVFADWIAIDEGTTVRLAAPEPDACSRADLARARVVGRAIDARGVRCGGRWIAVAPGERATSLQVATCDGATCGPLASWSMEPIAIAPLPSPRESEKSKWPAWATWTIAGVAVAGAAVGVVAIVEANKSAPVETRFVNGGIKVHGFPFTF